MSHFVSKVALSDGNDIVLRLLLKNIELNTKGFYPFSINSHDLDSCSLRCEKLLWGEDIEKFQSNTWNEFDMIIGSDIIYSAYPFNLLLLLLYLDL